MERQKIKNLITDKAILEVQDGNHGEKHPTAADYVEQGIPFLMARDFHDGQVDLNGACKIPKTLGDSLRIGFARTGDVLLTHKGSIGLVAIVPEVSDYVMLTPQVTYYRTNPAKLLNSYLKYAFQAPFFRDQLNSFSAQSTRPYIGITAQKELQLDVPPLPVQRRIAGVLSAYDDLIENNTRRIKILEEMAQALYREWFVHFRFPGHEKIPLVASPLGKIPEGWKVKKLADVAEVNRAEINARNAPDKLHYIDISSVGPGKINSIATYAFGDAPGRARRIVQHGDVLWSCVRPNRRSHAQVMHPGPNTIASTGFAVLTATRVPFTFLYFATTTDDFVGYLTNNATGAAYPAVNATTFERADLLIPPARLLKKFGDATIPIAEQIHTLQRQIQNLRRTRDLLLPRLLSGQIQLKN